MRKISTKDSPLADPHELRTYLGNCTARKVELLRDNLGLGWVTLSETVITNNASLAAIGRGSVTPTPLQKVRIDKVFAQVQEASKKPELWEKIAKGERLSKTLRGALRDGTFISTLSNWDGQEKYQKRAKELQERLRKIRGLREVFAFSDDQLAFAIGITTSTLTNWTHGRTVGAHPRSVSKLNAAYDQVFSGDPDADPRILRQRSQHGAFTAQAAKAIHERRFLKFLKEDNQKMQAAQQAKVTSTPSQKPELKALKVEPPPGDIVIDFNSRVSIPDQVAKQLQKLEMQLSGALASIRALKGVIVAESEKQAKEAKEAEAKRAKRLKAEALRKEQADLRAQIQRPNCPAEKLVELAEAIGKIGRQLRALEGGQK